MQRTYLSLSPAQFYQNMFFVAVAGKLGSGTGERERHEWTIAHTSKEKLSGFPIDIWVFFLPIFLWAEGMEYNLKLLAHMSNILRKTIFFVMHTLQKAANGYKLEADFTGHGYLQRVARRYGIHCYAQVAPQCIWQHKLEEREKLAINNETKERHPASMSSYFYCIPGCTLH